MLRLNKMPISVQWDTPEKTIIYARYERWTWDDFYIALHQCTELASIVTYKKKYRMTMRATILQHQSVNWRRPVHIYWII